jgi:amino acid transporter
MLQHNTLKLQHAIAMSIAAMSPVGAILFNTIPQAGLVGAAIPLCYAIGLVVALLVAAQVREMAAEFPTSGSLYTFVTQGLGVRWGFIAGWLSLISFGVAVPATIVVTGANLQALLLHASGVHLHWSLWYCLLTLILAILSFVGFESATTLGEEVQNPRKAIPIAMAISLVLVGVFYLLMAYVATIGYGIDRMANFAQDAAPFDTIARRVWGSGFALALAYSLPEVIDAAGIIAGYACAVAFLNGAARIVDAMSRELLFPAINRSRVEFK